jgi:tape measure domain-containing protein
MIVGDMEIRLRADIARLQRDMDSGRRVVNDASASMSRAADRIKTAFAGIAAGIGLSQIISMTDQYAKFTAQLRLASTSAREYAAAYADVKRISTAAQQDLQATGVLYARIANGTRELGTTQKQVAAITETVNMALKVSGATAAESASAQLQLSQAFASGTLRGEEFNAVNEAAPRLMLALADGIGVPVGALKKMAENGLITSKIMSDVLPNALEKLREEAKEVQTIAGAFTVLKNNMMEFVGVQSNASGAVSAMTGAIGLLANNLTLLAGAMLTVMAAKLGSFLGASVAKTYESVASNRALVAANLATANSQVAATSAIASTTAARLAELRAVVLAAPATDRLFLATTALIPAQGRAAAAATAHAAALRVQSLAMGQASIAGGILRGAVAFLGGPVGAIITLLGAGAIAWSIWGDKGSEAEKKVVDTLANEIDDYLANLNRQIEKLKERNELAGKGMVSAAAPESDYDKKREKIMAEINRIGNQADLNVAAKTEILKVWGGKLNQLTIDMQALNVAQQKNKDLTFSGKEADWLGKYGTAAQKTAYELDALRKEFGRVTPAMEAHVKSKYADKGAATAINQEASAYKNLVASIGEKIAANKLEMSGYNKLNDAQKMTIKLDESIASGKNKLSKESIESVRVMIATVADQDASIRSANDHKKLMDDALASTDKIVDAIDEQTRALQFKIKTYGLLPSAITAVQIAELEASQQSLALSDAGVADIQRKIDALKGLASAQAAAGALETNPGLTRAKELLDVMAQIDEVTKSAAAGMAESFGKVGSAIGGLTTALSGYGRAQAAIAAQLAAATKDAGGDTSKIAKANTLAAHQSAQAQVRSYGDMASAAKGFFKENTAGYKVMEGVEKAYRATEMAMAIETMITKSGILTAFTGMFVASKATEAAAEVGATGVSVAAAGTQSSAWGITAVVKALASLPFPANLAAGAATLAAVVAIGAKMIGGIGGGGGGGQSAADAQKAQGTGGVFGDADAKSASIAKSIELLEKNSGSLIPLNRGMLSALRAIEASMSGLTNILVRTPGVIDGSNLGIQEGVLAKSKGRSGVGMAAGAAAGAGYGATAGAILGPLGVAIGAVGGALLGAAVGQLMKLWGKTTQKIVDSGIQFGGSVRGLQAGQGINQYASVDTTKSSWFGLSKKTTNSMQTAGLSNELTAQFGLIFTNVENALAEAAGAIGIGSGQITSALDALTIDMTSISLKGLTGTALTDALNAVISKTTDEMAQAAIPGMDAFRQVGEGYAQTVIRIASNYAQLDVALSSIGITFGAVGVNSLAAREKLIELSGGIDALAQNVASFAENFLTEAERLAPVQKYVTEELARMGYAGVTTRDQFKDVAMGLNLATAKGAEHFAGLMSLQAAFAMVTPAIDHAAIAAANLAKAEQERTAAIEAQAAVLAAQAAALQATRDDAANLLSGVDAAFGVLQRVINAEKSKINEAHALTMKNLGERITTETAAVAKHKSLADSINNSLEQMRADSIGTGARADAQSQIKMMLAIARSGGPLPTSDALKGPLSALSKDASGQFATLVDMQRDAARSHNDLAELGALTDKALSVEERALAALESQRDNAQLAHAAEIARLDGIVAQAQTEIDIMRGMDVSLLTIAGAMAGLQLALLAAMKNPINASTGAITSAYQTSLGRAPEAAGLKYWQDAAAGGMGNSEIEKLIANSSEAKVQSLFKSVLGRSGDAAGLDYWTQQMNSGLSVDAARQMFMQSDEYKRRQGIPGFAVGINRVPFDMPAMIHKDEAVIPASFNPFNPNARPAIAGGDTQRLERLVEALTAEVSQLRKDNSAENIAIAKNTLTVADIQEKQEAIGLPAERAA